VLGAKRPPANVQGLRRHRFRFGEKATVLEEESEIAQDLRQVRVGRGQRGAADFEGFAQERLGRLVVSTGHPNESEIVKGDADPGVFRTENRSQSVERFALQGFRFAIPAEPADRGSQVVE